MDHQRQRGGPSSSGSPTSTRRPAIAASRLSWSSAARPASPSARRKTSWASAPAPPASSCSRTASFRNPAVLGEVGKGYKVAIETLNEGRIGIGAQMVGLAQGALDHTLKYVRERKQFGKPIADFQGVQFQLARMAIDVETSRLLVYNAARLRDAGLPFPQEAAMCKIVSSEAAERVTSLAVNLYGGAWLRQGLPRREKRTATRRLARSTRAPRTCSS
ncbi:MAG: acyl-CoA dehydrogenase family protein [Vicinamibacterales bacterium]